MVEELLQLLIGVVDTQLLKRVQLWEWGGGQGGEWEEERTSQLILRTFLRSY